MGRLLLILLLCSVLFSGEFICTNKEINTIISDKRFKQVDKRVFIDSRTVTKDEDGDMVVWSVFFVTKELMDSEKFNPVSRRTGYFIDKNKIDMNRNKIAIVKTVEYSCGGEVLSSLDLPLKLTDIMPNSVSEGIAEVSKRYVNKKK